MYITKYIERYVFTVRFHFFQEYYFYIQILITNILQYSAPHIKLKSHPRRLYVQITRISLNNNYCLRYSSVDYALLSLNL